MSLTGRTLGRYRILDLIGAGGMGDVYRARDERLGRDVAIKVLPEAVAGDADRLARFEREARALARLEHPNILAIHDLGRDGDVSFSVTELLSGETLRSRLTRERLSWRKVVEVAAAIADGLAVAHVQDVVHRDIKPANIFLTADGRVKILDFGLAASGPAVLADAATQSIGAGVQTAAGMMLGTVGYMAPEQVQGAAVSGRTDIFSLGCVLFEMLTGDRAFARPTINETLAAIVAAPVPDLSLSGSDAPPDLARVVQRCLEKQPGERFQSAHDLAFALRSASAGVASATAQPSEPAQVPPAAPGRRGNTRPSERRRVTVGVAVAATIAIAAVAVALRYRPGAASPPPAAKLDRAKFVVTVFSNRTGDASLDRFGLLCAESIVNRVSRLSDVRVVASPTASAGRTTGEATDDAGFRALGEQTGAGRVVSGRYYLDGQVLRIQVQTLDPATGLPAYVFDPIKGSRDQLGPAADQVAGRVMGAAAMDADGGFTGNTRYRAPLYDAHVAIRQGDNTQDPKAREAHYRRALELDPHEYRAATRLFAILRNASSRLGEADALWLNVGAAYAEFTQYEQAAYRLERARFDGKWVEYLAATKDQFEIGKNEEGLVFVADGESRLHHLHSAEAAYLRLKEMSADARPGRGTRFGNASGALSDLSQIRHEFGRYAEQLEDARLGQTRDPGRGSFFSDETGALVGLGRLADIEDVVRRVEASATVRQRYTPGTLMLYAARELRAHGHLAESMKMAERAVQFYRARLIGTAPAPAERGDLAAAIALVERWPEAQAAYASLARDVPGELPYQGWLGVIAARLGHGTEARRIADSLARVSRPYLLGEHHYERARVLAALGDGEAAMAALNRAIQDGQSWVSGKIHRDLAFEPIREYSPFLEFLKSKD